MNKATYLGELEQMVLLAVLRLEDEAYGMAIMDELETTAKRKVTHGALYITLERLINKGCLKTRMGEPTPERGGRAKRYVRVTAAGRAALRTSGRALRDLWQDHLALLEE